MALSLGNSFYGAEGDRTPDLLTASQTLSQLSYSPNLSNYNNAYDWKIKRYS